MAGPVSRLRCERNPIPAGGTAVEATIRMREFRPSLRTAFVLALLAALGATALVSSASGKSGHRSTAPAVPGQILVGFKAPVSASAQNEVLARVGAVRKRRFGGIRGALVSVEPGSAAQTIRSLERDGRVAYAEPNFVLRTDVPNDPFMTRLWGLDNLGQTVNWSAGAPDADIDAREAWSVSTGSPDVVVAVIDTGVELAHPDLAANIWVNQGEDCPGCRTNGTDDDGNGYVDDWRGWDFVNGDNNPTDDMGHGTHVAGNDRRGREQRARRRRVTWSTKVMPLKFLSAAGTGTVADAISAILYANANGAAILNTPGAGTSSRRLCSTRSSRPTRAERSSSPPPGTATSNSDLEPNYPSGYEAANVVSVGATDQYDRRAWFSNYGTRRSTLARRARTSTRPGPAARTASRTAPRWPRRTCPGPRRSRRPSSRARAGSVSRRCFSHGRPDLCALRNEQDRRAAERRQSGAVLRLAAGVDRVAAHRLRVERGTAGCDPRLRCALWRTDGGFGQREPERKPARADGAGRRPVHGLARSLRAGRST